MLKHILLSFCLATFTLSGNNGYKRSYTWVDTAINFTLCTYPCLALSYLKQNYQKHGALIRIPNRAAQITCAGIFLAREWYNRKK
jgi:hypothetical protein